MMLSNINIQYYVAFTVLQKKGISAIVEIFQKLSNVP